MEINNEQVTALDSQGKKGFSVCGCENCNHGLGGDTITCKVFTENMQDYDDHYELELCHNCLCAYYNGDELADDCENIYKI